MDIMDDNFPLPSLNPLVKLHKGPDKADGTPTWNLHHPISNKYFQIGWAEFECLARFHRYKTPQDLIDAVKAETTVDVDIDDVRSLVVFLHTNGLVSGGDAAQVQMPETKKQLWLMKILHHYLFFTVPLFKPQSFLNSTYRYVRPLLSKPFLTVSYLLLAVMLLLTIQRADEFLHTFFQLFSIEGALILAVVFFFIKILHELGHAYTATKYNVPVPHMGVAFIVMYPVLYTETTGAWQLSSRRARVHIGLAGIATELVIAAYALLLWHILPPGLPQSLAFSAVAISLIGSLLINLNPLMRFDGYYVLSDMAGIENLHSRAIAFAKWKLRRVLFNLADEKPDSEEQESFLTLLGFAVMIYRFFLFTGIALLVYHIFFQPLGFILMVVELAFFIGLPVWKELLVWYERRAEILSHWRARIVAICVVALFILMFLPLQTSISVPAVYHAKDYRAIYPPYPALVTEINVSEGDEVLEGDVLLKLESFELERDYKLARQDLTALRNLKRREQTDSELFRERRGEIEQQIEAAEEKMAALERQKEQLIVTADFAGTVRDMPSDLHTGRSVKSNMLLLRLVKQDEPVLTGYIREDQVSRISNADKGVFYPDYSMSAAKAVSVQKIESVNAKSLSWPELSSLYGGPLPSEIYAGDGRSDRIVPRQSLYALQFTPDKAVENQDVILRGHVQIRGRAVSPVQVFFRRAAGLFIRESGLNSL